MEWTTSTVAGMSTEEIENSVSNTSLNATVTLPMAMGKPTLQLSLIMQVRITFGLVISIIGSVANTVVLTVLTLARREYGSNVNTLIINQCVMDLFACVSVVILHVLARGFAIRDNQIASNIVCVVVEGGVLASFGATAGKMGLVIISFERYFKIVHAIAHRKHYRDWMTKVGVALPWIGSMCLVLFPSIGTTRVVNGRCLPMRNWPHEGMAKVRKLSFRAFCYCHSPIPFRYLSQFYALRQSSLIDISALLVSTLCLKKVPTFKLSATLSNLNRFSKFLHCYKAYEICYKTYTLLPISP